MEILILTSINLDSWLMKKYYLNEYVFFVIPILSVVFSVFIDLFLFLFQNQYNQHTYFYSFLIVQVIDQYSMTPEMWEERITTSYAQHKGMLRCALIMRDLITSYVCRYKLRISLLIDKSEHFILSSGAPETSLTHTSLIKIVVCIF